MKKEYEKEEEEEGGKVEVGGMNRREGKDEKNGSIGLGEKEL